MCVCFDRLTENYLITTTQLIVVFFDSNQDHSTSKNGIKVRNHFFLHFVGLLCFEFLCDFFIPKIGSRSRFLDPRKLCLLSKFFRHQFASEKSLQNITNNTTFAHTQRKMKTKPVNWFKIILDGWRRNSLSLLSCDPHAC